MEKYSVKRGTKKNEWICTDTVNGITVTFENGKFNDTQEYAVLNENMTIDFANRLPAIVAEMSDYLRENHYNKIFERQVVPISEAFDIMLSISDIEKKLDITKSSLNTLYYRGKRGEVSQEKMRELLKKAGFYKVEDEKWSW